MRKREEIEVNVSNAWKSDEMQRLIMEVLLDIREILANDV